MLKVQPDPSFRIYAFQDEEDGAMDSKLFWTDAYTFINADETEKACFFTPAGLPITIKPKGKVLIVKGKIDSEQIVRIGENEIRVTPSLPIGALVSFEEDGVLYSATTSYSPNQFNGYYSVEKNDYKYDSITPEYNTEYFINVVDGSGNLMSVPCSLFLKDNTVKYTGDLNRYKGDGALLAKLPEDIYTIIERPISNEELIELKKRFVERLNSQVQEGSYFYIDAEFEKLRNELSIKDITDRLGVYAKEANGKRIYVTLLNSSGKLTHEQIENLSVDVFTQSVLKNSSDALFIAIPVWNIKVIKTDLRSKDLDDFGISVYNKAYQALNGQHGRGADLETSILALYRNIPKPYYQFCYFINFNGEVITNGELKSKGNIVGKEHVYEVFIEEDAEIDRYADLLKRYKSLKQSSVNAYGVANYNPYTAKEIARVYDALYKYDNEYVTQGKKRLDHGLKESYVATARLKAEESVVLQFIFWHRDRKFKSYVEGSRSLVQSPSDKAFVKEVNPVVYNDMLETIDVVGLMLAPVNADFVADLAGLVYAGYYKDKTNTAIYSTSLVIPLANAKVLKELLSGSLRIVKSGGILKFVAKNAKTAEELALILVRSGKVSQSLAQELASKVSKHPTLSALFTEELALLVAKSSGSAESVLKSLNRLEAEELIELSLDLNKNTTFAKAFFAKVGDNPNLVESWKRLIDAPDAIRKNIDLLDDISSWPASWKLTKFGDGILVTNNSGKQLGTIYSDKIVAPGRRVSGEAGNALLNRVPLTKNMKYDVDGFIYQTDELGRVVTTNADLDDIARIRLGNQQIRAVDVKDGVRGADQGGHIVGSRFFGPGEQINLYPQSANLNQGSWKQMENAWADAMVDKFDDAGNLIEKGKDVKVKVTAIFEGTSQRPVGFEVDYWIDGNLTTRTFPNN